MNQAPDNQSQSSDSAPSKRPNLFPNKTRKDKLLNGLVVILLVLVFVAPIVVFSYKLLTN